MKDTVYIRDELVLEAHPEGLYILLHRKGKPGAGTPVQKKTPLAVACGGLSRRKYHRLPLNVTSTRRRRHPVHRLHIQPYDRAVVEPRALAGPIDEALGAMVG